MDQRHWATSFFVQDDWKVTSRLSMNLGLRYDFITPALEANNRQANFDPTTGTLVNATDGSLEDRGLVEPDKNNFAPRVGVVYQVTDSMVVRGGYGIFYNLFDRIGSEDQIAFNPGNGLVSLQPATATVASGPHFFLQQRASPRATSIPRASTSPAPSCAARTGIPPRRRSTSSAWGRRRRSRRCGSFPWTSSAPRAATSPTSST